MIGRGWDQNKWGDTRFPTHDALSRVTPNNPVVLTRIDGHAILANAAAMKAAGVTAATQRSRRRAHRAHRDRRADRRFRRQRDGARRTRRSAALARRDARPPRSPQSPSRTVGGSIGLHDPGEPREVLDVFEELAKAGKFNLRVYAMISDDSAAIEHYFQRGPQSALYDNHLWIRVDQALRRRRARLARRGAARSRTPTIRRTSGCSSPRPSICATSPRARSSTDSRSRRTPSAIAATASRSTRTRRRSKTVPTVDHRFRIEHVQVLDHADVPRFAQLGVIPSMQAVHQTSDMYWAPTRARLRVARARRLRLALAARDRRDHPQRQRLPGRAREPAVLLPRRRLAPGRAQLAAGRVVSRSSG